MSGFIQLCHTSRVLHVLASTSVVKNVDLLGYVFFVSLFILALYTGLIYFGKKLNRTGLPNGGYRTRTVPLGMDKRVIVFEIESISYILYTDRQHTVLLDKRSDLGEGFYRGHEEPGMTGSGQFSKVLGSILKRQGNEDE